MTHLVGSERAQTIQKMFMRIAWRYDFMNKLMTGGQDFRWRKRVIELARMKNHASLLDIGTGTGDLAREALSQFPEAKVIASDFTFEMMRAGQQNRLLNFSAADALCLPFRASSFDVVISGFLMRNVVDLQKALDEQHRVLKRGGRIVILDTTRPKRNILSPFIWLYMHVIIPLLGGLLTGSMAAYRYLPQSTEKFVTAEELATRMAIAGFRKIGFERFMFGTIAIHWAEKLTSKVGSK